MSKQLKYIKIICIVLIFSILALALAVGFFAISALKNSYLPDPLSGYEEKKEELPPPTNNIDDLLPYRVGSDVSVDAVYLRLESFGDFNGQTWLPATPYDELIDGEYPATFLGTKQIEKWKLADAIALTIDPNNTVNIIPQYTATNNFGGVNYNIPSNDVREAVKGDESYNLYYYNYTDTSLKPSVVILEYERYEAHYREFVKDQYLTIDGETKDYMLDIAEKQGFDKNDYELADKISAYVKGVGIYDMDYNTELDKEENIAISFVEEYKKGTCKHFATLATLLFRSLGIPARYTIGYMTETVENQWVQVTNFDAHAWVEVYVDGFGWKNIEVTPKPLDTDITVKPTDVNKLFDGTPLYPENKIEGFEEFEEKGYTYEAVVSGERTEPGISESKIDSLKVFDSFGNDVTSEFKFAFETGEILVYAGVVSLESDDFTYMYSKIPPTSQLSGCRVVFPEGEELADGYNVEIKAKVLPSAIGTYPHTFDVVITNDVGEDITNLYKFEYNLGSVTVKANMLTLKAGSAEKLYDGSELVCNEIEIVEGALAEGDEIYSYEIIGSQTLPGQSPNVIEISSIVIVNKVSGEDVTSNYLLSVEDGSLTVYVED